MYVTFVVDVAVFEADTYCVPPFRVYVEEYVTVDVMVDSVVCADCPFICVIAVTVEVELAVI